MGMEERLLKLINDEDKKNPLTDEEIAQSLATSRQNVVRLRQLLGIANYSERRLPYIKKAIKETLERNQRLSDRELTRLIQEQGFTISKFLVAAIRKEVGISKQPGSGNNMEADGNGLNEHELDEQELLEAAEEDEEIYGNIIGAHGSIMQQIKQAEAAVLYPPNGLHTLILGETGTGKTLLAEAMFKLALKKGRIKNKESFVRFNCADYYNNPQLLLSQLFGHVKGAFTGADYDKKGLIEKADGGIILLDEIHRLPVEGQEILFTIMDKGVFRRLGETEQERKIAVMIIGATTENINSHLTLTFKRRVPMIIEIPPIRNRDINDRFEMVIYFFKKESERIGTKMIVSSEVICGLLLYDCPGNIGQLRSDIQVACARAYLRFLNNNSENITISLMDFNPYVHEGVSRKKYCSKDIAKYIESGIEIIPGQNQVGIYDEKDMYIMPHQIYEFLEKRYAQLLREGIQNDQLYAAVGKELEIKLQRAMSYLKNTKVGPGKIDIIRLVGKKLFRVVEETVDIAQQDLGDIDPNLVQYLALHLYQTVERVTKGKQIFNPQLDRIKETYRREYATAEKMVEYAQKKIGIAFPEDEIGFVALYLSQNNKKNPDDDAKCGIMIITHGYVAREMANVANSLLGNEFIQAVCIDLNDSIERALEETVELARELNKGKGILVLADMGAALTFGELITKETGIPTKTISKVHTAMVLDAGFKALNGTETLEQLYDSIRNNNAYIGYQQSKYGNKAIITLCLTGFGSALEIKSLLEQSIPELIEKQIEIIPLGLLQQEDPGELIEKIRQDKDIIALIGTIDPGIRDIPYIPLSRALDYRGLNELKRIINLKIPLEEAEEAGEKKRFQYPFEQVFREELIIPRASYSTKDQVMEALANLLIKHGYVKESFLLGLYQREQQSPTKFSNGIAIPHTYSDYVIKSAIAVATLEKPVKWDNDYYADKVFLIAMKEQSSLIFRYIYQLGKNQERLAKLSDCRKKEEVINVLYE
jgi:transcriptional regulator with AAA-type ATPase domain/transcriptional regulatory protein LevR